MSELKLRPPKSVFFQTTQPFLAGLRSAAPPALSWLLPLQPMLTAPTFEFLMRLRRSIF